MLYIICTRQQARECPNVPPFEQEMGETLVKIITPMVCAVKEAAPDSRGRSVSCCAQQFRFLPGGDGEDKGIQVTD